jgi:PhzF family phenazine biosynthesis protein
MKKIPLYQVDAFTSERFRGNPAAICILENMDDLTEDEMQNIAAEMNLSETAFIAPMSREQSDNYLLRWFTPKVEVSLCGHATLASAHVLFQELKVSHDKIYFHTLSGELIVTRLKNKYQMDFPIGDSKPAEIPDSLINNLGISKEQIVNTNINKFVGELTAILEVKSGEIVRNLTPNWSVLVNTEYKMDIGGVYVTARGDIDEVDFVSRCFFPWIGINEDPVTGSAYTVLGPYWKEKMGKNRLVAHQVSDRLGKIWLDIPDPNPQKRINILGNAVTVLIGSLLL